MTVLLLYTKNRAEMNSNIQLHCTNLNGAMQQSCNSQMKTGNTDFPVFLAASRYHKIVLSLHVGMCLHSVSPVEGKSGQWPLVQKSPHAEITIGTLPMEDYGSGAGLDFHPGFTTRI